MFNKRMAVIPEEQDGRNELWWKRRDLEEGEVDFLFHFLLTGFVIVIIID